ncbi:unnamed protein product [Musa banksii]
MAEVGETMAASSGGEGGVEAPHRLERKWTFWFDNQSKPKQGAAWGSALRKVYTFDTVEEFWCLYDQIFRPSKLPANTDFHCFKSGIEPKWEDPECANGGKWTVTCNRKATLDTLWLETLMALIGEQFEESEEICGIVVSVRQRQDKLALWTKAASNEAVQMSIGRKWKEIIDFNEKIVYSFHVHPFTTLKPQESVYHRRGNCQATMKPSILAFVLLIIAICSGVVAAAARSPAEFVRESCMVTQYPALCEQCLVAYAQAVHLSKHELARAALSVSADRAGSASAFVRRMSAGGGKSLRSREAGAVRDCIGTMQDSEDRLRRSVREMRRMGRPRSPRFAWHLSNVRTWVSASLTDETTCLDGLSQYASPAVRAAIRKKVLEVSQVTSNALALVNQLSPRN